MRHRREMDDILQSEDYRKLMIDSVVLKFMETLSNLGAEKRLARFCILV